MRTSRSIGLTLALLMLNLVACTLMRRETPESAGTAVGPAEASPTPAPTVTLAPTSEPTATTAPPTEPAPTAAPTSEATPTGEPTAEEESCTFGADYVADVTVPDDTALEPSSAFVKTWRVRNSGTCDWEAGTKLIFDSGNQMDGPDALTVGAVAPGSEVDISVSLEAPTTPGTYRGDWQLATAEGMRFGSVVYVQIVVPEATVEPTETAEPTEIPEGCVAPHPDLEPLLDLAEAKEYDIGCPSGEAYTVEEDGGTGALQAFWANIEEENPNLHYRSLMIWRADTRQIYVIDGVHTAEAAEGTLTIYTDTWEEGQPHIPPDCGEMTPPEGYRLPERGFGKIWCDYGLVDEIGWPQDPEVQVSLLVQPTEHGLLTKTSGTNADYLVLLMPGAGRALATWSPE